MVFFASTIPTTADAVVVVVGFVQFLVVVVGTPSKLIRYIDSMLDHGSNRAARVHGSKNEASRQAGHGSAADCVCAGRYMF